MKHGYYSYSGIRFLAYTHNGNELRPGPNYPFAHVVIPKTGSVGIEKLG
jgi:hypothetical protein